MRSVHGAWSLGRGRLSTKQAASILTSVRDQGGTGTKAQVGNGASVQDKVRGQEVQFLCRLFYFFTGRPLFRWSDAGKSPGTSAPVVHATGRHYLLAVPGARGASQSPGLVFVFLLLDPHPSPRPSKHPPPPVHVTMDLDVRLEPWNRWLQHWMVSALASAVPT